MSRKILLVDEFQTFEPHELKKLVQFGLLVTHLTKEYARNVGFHFNDEAGYVVFLTGKTGLETSLTITEKLSKACPGAVVFVFTPIMDVKSVAAFLNKGAVFVYQVQPTAELITASIMAFEKQTLRKGSSLFSYMGLTLNPNAQTVLLDGRSLVLTKIEYSILLFLLKHQKQTVKKERLVENLWKDNAEHKSSYDFLYAHIKNLRKKLKAAGGQVDIKNVYGMGYKLKEV